MSPPHDSGDRDAADPKSSKPTQEPVISQVDPEKAKLSREEKVRQVPPPGLEGVQSAPSS